MHTVQIWISKGCRIGALLSQVGFLRLCGYRLEFNKVAQDNPLMGYANIVPNDEGVVEGALYEIGESSLSNLDRHEGYPKHYKKIKVEVVLLNGSKTSAITYIANPDKIKDGLKPNKKYLGHLLAGGDMLSESYFKWLQDTETLD